MPLTNIAVRNARAKPKAYRLYDQKGLYLDVRPNGSRYWRMKYRFAGVEKLLALGVFPDIALKEARESRDRARKQLADGIDPVAFRREEKVAGADRSSRSFEVVAREWFKKHEFGWAENHSSNVIGRLERDVFPSLGRRAI